MYALSDLTVIDFSTTIAGSFLTKIMSGLGARVIKVEPPGGEPTRYLPPFWRESEYKLLFCPWL